MRKTFITGLLVGIILSCHFICYSVPIQVRIGVVANQVEFDENTVFLCLMQGTNGSTTFTDISTGGIDSQHTITANGDAQISTAVNDPFGNNVGVGLFDGTGDYTSTPSSSDFDYGSNDFTIEAWIYFNSLTGFQVLIGTKWQENDRGWIIYKNNTSTDLVFGYSTNGINTNDITFSWTPTINTWYHVAIVRDSTELKIYIDGSQIGSTYNIGSSIIYYNNSTLYIGADSGTASFFNGYASNFRISKIARYTSSFTPPTKPFNP